MRAVVLMVAVAQIAGCASRAPGSAPVEDRRPAARAPAAPKAAAPRVPVPSAPASVPAPTTYTVKRGDTLYSIALEHGQDYRDVAQWNSLDDPSKIGVGQVLRVAPPPQPAVALGPGRSGSRIESRPLETPQKPVAAAPAPIPAPAPAQEKPLLEVQPLSFAWPVRGKVVAEFAEPRQKGIDIQGRAGDPVIAAAAGRVTYAGSGIPGLGKLIVLKHDQGYITVYAHNKDILVKEQQSVKRGDKIAEHGDKLHFQIRKGAAAVDPLLYLPRS